MTIDLKELLFQDMQMDAHAMTDRVIVVTGAGQGIGLQTARAFAFLGAKVILAELSEQGKTAEELIQAEGGTARFIKTDVSDTDSVANLHREVHQSFGSADILINNAIFIKEGRVLEMTPETWDRTIAVNLRGTFLTCRAFLAEMLEMDRGLIINMVSTDAMPGLSAYIASKGGITAFSQSLALELEGTQVRAIPFGPGMVDTPGIRSVATNLAPQLGLTETEFLNLSLHADYDGLMPPEHAGAAAVYLAIHLAETFHGQVVSGYEVLERAGILQTSRVVLPKAISEPLSNQSDLKSLLETLSTILTETEAEFGKLPVFVRPMAKGGFKNKTGMSLADWQRLTSSLAEGVKPPPPDFDIKLNGLAKYYRETPTETARFTKDEATLQMVTETALSRLKTIHEIKSIIG